MVCLHILNTGIVYCLYTLINNSIIVSDNYSCTSEPYMHGHSARDIGVQPSRSLRADGVAFEAWNHPAFKMLISNEPRKKPSYFPLY